MAKKKTASFIDGRLEERTKTCPPVVAVTWVDACLAPMGSLDVSEGWDKRWNSGVLQQTVGFLLRQDARWVTIGMERNAAVNNSFRTVQDIPTCAVCEMKILQKGT